MNYIQQSMRSGHETYHRPETISQRLAPTINHEAPKLGRLVLACDTGPMIFQACVLRTAYGASLMKDHGPVTGLTLTQQSVLGRSSGLTLGPRLVAGQRVRPVFTVTTFLVLVLELHSETKTEKVRGREERSTVIR